MLIHFIIYNLFLSILLYASLAVDPRMWLHRMPPAVVAKVPPKTAREKQKFLFWGILTAAIMFLYPPVVVYLQHYNWPQTLWMVLSLYVSFNLVDTLILDLLIFVYLTPPFIIIPGTQLSDYKDARYHVRAGLMGMVISLVGGLVMGGLVILAQSIFYN